MKCAQEEAEKVTNFSERNLKFWYQKIKNFALWIFNYLLADHEINDFQAISCFLDLSNYYMFLITENTITQNI